MIDDRLIKISADGLELFVEKLFDRASRIPGTGLAEIPIVGGAYLLAFAVPPCLKQRLRNAIDSSVRFPQDAPGWRPLPLHQNIREAFAADDDIRLNVLAYFADSLAAEEWDYDLHPRFGAFISGLLACKHTPHEIRSNRYLRKEFPPHRLKGLCDGLDWRSPERLAQDRGMRKMIAAHEAARAEGGP